MAKRSKAAILRRLEARLRKKNARKAKQAAKVAMDKKIESLRYQLRK